MARMENSFALLLDDESDDIDVLIASASGKSAVSEKKPVPASLPTGPAKLPSKPLPPAEAVKAERGRGRGGRGRGFRRGDVDSESGGRENNDYFNDGRPRSDDYQKSGDRAEKPFLEGGRGRGRARGRGRGCNVNREFGNENRVYGNDGGDHQENDAGEKKDYVDLNQPFRKENKLNGYGNRGFGGAKVQYGGGVRSHYPRTDGLDSGEQKQPEADENKKSATVIEATGWDVPEPTEVPKIKLVDKPEQLGSHDTDVKKVEEEDKEMTLDEYVKVLSEKRKALQVLKTEERKVALDKDFLEMQLLDKKKDDDSVLKSKSEKEKHKKKDCPDKEEKVRKSVSINEFLKPADVERYAGPSRGRGGGRGRGRGFRGDFSRPPTDNTPAPSIGDPSQFPQLGGQ